MSNSKDCAVDTLTGAQARLEKKEISAVELARHFIERIKAIDPALNSVITLCEEAAIAQAEQADARRAHGEAGPLTGIPFLHKDLFCTRGIRTSCGSRMLDNFVAPYDATVTEKLAAAGMVMLGKANMDEFAMGSSNETSFYGVCRNPWDTSRVPGGSSGGSAAAVAAGLAPVATATDTGGSIRLPAAFCGISGIKPTYGRVSRYGMIAFASSLDQGGPMAHTAEDCAHLLGAMAGFDVRDATSLEDPVPDYTATLDAPLTGLKFGVPKDFFAEGLDPKVAQAIETASGQLESLGARRVEVTLPHLRASIPTYYVIAPAEASSNLARYDGVRFGYRCSDPQDITDLITRSRSEAFGEEVKRRILTGTFVLSAGYYDAYYGRALAVRKLIAQDFDAAFEAVDIIVGPTAPGPPFALDTFAKDPVKMYLTDIFTASANLAGLPAMSIPAGLAEGLPVGLQLIGRRLDEARLLNVAHQFQQVSDWHLMRPEISNAH